MMRLSAMGDEDHDYQGIHKCTGGMYLGDPAEGGNDVYNTMKKHYKGVYLEHFVILKRREDE